MVHGLEAEYWGQVDFIYLDREAPENAAIVQEYGVRYQPIIYVLAPDGTVIQPWFGAPTEEDIRMVLDGYLAENGG